MPRLVYGTAWKKDQTARLVEQALRAGFRGVDTACQPKHYQEPLVGDGIAAAIAANVVKREDLYIQTKFTPVSGQDPARIPYDPNSPLPEQVKTSVATSLRNLKVSYIDSLVIHSPLRTLEETLIAWRVLEEFVKAGTIRQLGISNCYDPTFFEQLWQRTTIKPAVLQNRFYRDSGYDVALRNACRQRRIAYQSFWTLTANPHVLRNPSFASLASQMRLTPPQLMYRFMMDIDCVPLCGTTNPEHMTEGVKVLASPPLSHDAVRMILSMLPAQA